MANLTNKQKETRAKVFAFQLIAGFIWLIAAYFLRENMFFYTLAVVLTSQFLIGALVSIGKAGLDEPVGPQGPPGPQGPMGMRG